MNLTKEQQEILDTVGIVKAQVDEAIARRKEEYERGLELDRAPLYEAARRAGYALIPARKIGMMLGTSDHKTIKQYITIPEEPEDN